MKQIKICLTTFVEIIKSFKIILSHFIYFDLSSSRIYIKFSELLLFITIIIIILLLSDLNLNPKKNIHFLILFYKFIFLVIINYYFYLI